VRISLGLRVQQSDFPGTDKFETDRDVEGAQSGGTDRQGLVRDDWLRQGGPAQAVTITQAIVEKEDPDYNEGFRIRERLDYHSWKRELPAAALHHRVEHQEICFQASAKCVPNRAVSKAEQYACQDSF
jgi:hypothetical protein